ncbi:InlB B-repeat-containing protein [Treponema sp.]|uniref:InlB B-repeat-containing protein n=1 Tax=Treponema sp. TaxID=166 RepID=UPI00298E0DD4|nr:InlB B-repeat-containing protein [Treponema sp.]MCQ2240076.1 InlB B-repeat-containing protein [Treponema sp.]
MALFFSCSMGEEKIEYTVVHMQQNVQNDDYTAVETEKFSCQFGEMTDIQAKEYTGFTVRDFTQEKITDSKEIKILYDRNYVTYKFNLAGGTGAKSVTAKYGTPVDENSVQEPVKAGSTFSFWQPELPQTFEEDCTFTANWNYPYYKVQYLFQNKEDDGYLESPDYPQKKVYGRKGYKTEVTAEDISGFAAKNIEQTVISDEEQTVKVYYDRKIITLFIDLDGGIGTNCIKGKFGSPVTASLFGTLEKKGYSFWKFDAELPEIFTLEDNNKTVAKALWSYSGKSHYGVQFYMQNISDDHYTKLEIETAVHTGETGGLTDIHLNANGKLYVGETKYEFTGFHPAVDDKGKLISENVTIDPSETTIAKVYFDRNVSTISILSTSMFYIYGEELQKITRDGTEYNYYEIKGRYGEAVEVPYASMKINSSFYKHWENYKDTNGNSLPKFYPEDSTVYEIRLSQDTSGSVMNTYNLYYDFNDEDGPKVIKGNSFTDPINPKNSSDSIRHPNDVTREGYTLKGYTLNKDGSGTLYEAGIYHSNFAPTPYHDVDVTLYAQWEKKQ